ncbi:hypothetical protein [Nesterenkonia alba]|uniref:hypothetical protein n=1 Tax=Nesterenkonia alba TaxID=515814 RepID=UPI0012EBF546|nr:hypothetical protein [Nesterenkonia alba]
MTVTARIQHIVFDALEKHPEGLQWAELLRIIEDTDPTIHPKTANGVVWKLVENHPETIHKPARGRFQLKKFAPETH